MDNSTLLVFYPDSLSFTTPPNNPAQNPSVDFQGLRLTLNPANGLLQVLELGNSNKVLFSWGLSNKVCTGGNGKGCHIVFQADGNLVIYYPDNSGIGTSTYNQNAAYVFFTTSPPYFSVVSSSCVQLWPNANNGPSVGPLPRTTPVMGNTYNVVVSNLKPISSSSWKKFFGVNTHCSQGWNSAMVYNLTTYVGVGAIRDSIPSPSQAADYARMFAAGIQLTVVAGGSPNKTELAKQVQSWSAFQTSQPGMLRYIEGYNEINNFKFTYNGYDPSKTAAGMAQAQTDLYYLVRSVANLNGVYVLDLTGNTYLDGASFGLLNYSGHADFGTLHAYAYGGWPSEAIAGSNSLFLLGLSGTYPTWNNALNNYVISETGYHSDSFSNGVTENAQAKLLVNSLLNGISAGFREIYLYELIDEVWSGYNGPESHFGLFRNNQTPKPAARALHFLSGLLKDTKSVANPTSLSFTLNGLPVGSKYVLFQNSNSSYFLVIWNNSPVYDPASQSDIPAQPVTASLVLSGSKTVLVYDVFSTTADDTKPLSPISTTTASTVNFRIADTAVVLSFK